MELQELENNLSSVVEYAFEHGEILKAYQLIKSAPIPLQDSKLLARIEERLNTISDFQNNGRFDAGFVDPPDVSKKLPYVKLKQVLEDIKNVYYLLDVGCFSGWLGRNLSLWGYKVHGIDLDRKTIEQARLLATGTSATYDVLEGTKAGQVYFKQFDGAVLFDVLEHVFDDKLLLQSVENAVRGGGYIFINLPKYDIRNQLSRGNTPDYIKEHLRSYSKKDVKKLFKGKSNLKIEDIPDKDDPSYFIYYQI